MSNVNKAVLKECLFESILADIKEIEAIDYSSVKATDTFKERIKSTILEKRPVEKKITTKRAFIILVAAILVSLSIMLAVSAEIRNTVADFFVKVYDTFTEFFIVSEEQTNTTGNQNKDSTVKQTPTTIETEYVPGYIEENNYVQLDRISSHTQVFSVWSNGNAIIDFTQDVIANNDITLDTENSKHQIKYIGEIKTYCVLKNNIYYIQWVDFGYFFTLSCDEALGWEEIEKIVLSLAPANN